MKIDVRHIAKLAKLRIDEDKLPELARQIEDILGMVENLPEMQDGKIAVDPENAMVLRSDDIGASLARDELLQNAPQTQAGCIVVPRTV